MYIRLTAVCGAYCLARQHALLYKVHVRQYLLVVVVLCWCVCHVQRMPGQRHYYHICTVSIYRHWRLCPDCTIWPPATSYPCHV